MVRRTLIAALAVAAVVGHSGMTLAADPAPTKTPRPFDGGPPFDTKAPTPHQITLTIDTAPARDLLALLTGAPEATATLRRLKESRPVALAVAQEGISNDDYFGRIVASVAGTSDPLISSFGKDSERYRAVLDTLDEEGPATMAVGARRIASILPASPAISARLVIVPFFSTAGFFEVMAVRDGETTYLVADLPRLIGDPTSPPVPREVMLGLLRAACSEAWRSLFAAFVRKPPGWTDEKAPDFDALLARTVADGPVTLFLFADDFSPIGSLLEEPIARAFARWNMAAQALLDPKRKVDDKRNVLNDTAHGDFWRRSANIVGARMTDAVLRQAGREAYLKALTEGPRAVVGLYETVAKAAKAPPLGPAVKKALSAPPVPPPEKAP